MPCSHPLSGARPLLGSTLKKFYPLKRSRGNKFLRFRKIYRI